MAYANDPPSKLTARTSAFEHEREKKFNQIEEKTLPKALRTQALTALTSNFG